MWCPVGFDKINIISNYWQPSGIKADSRYTDTFDRMLYERVCSIFDITYNAGFDIDYFKFCLLGGGFIAITETPAYGIIAQYPALSGYDMYCKPTTATINTYATNANIALNDLKIGKDCAVIYLRPTRCGIFDIIGYYSYKLALVASAFDMNIFNSKLAFLMASKNKSAAQTLKKIYDQVQAGNPAVAFDSSIKENENSAMRGKSSEPFEFFNKDLKNNFISNELIEVFEKLLDQFNTEVGIPSVGSDKKERLNVMETEKNDIESVTRLTTWLETMQAGIDIANKLYPSLKLSAKIRDYKKAGVINGTV